MLALDLFLAERSYVSALTLAGAAEEIFGKALTHQGKEHSLGYKFDGIAPVHEALYRKPLAWKPDATAAISRVALAMWLATPRHDLLVT